MTSLTSCYVTFPEKEGSLSRSEPRAKMSHLGEHSRNATPSSLRYFPEVIRRPWISAAPSFHCPSIRPSSALPAPLCPHHALILPSGGGTGLEPQCLPNGINAGLDNANDLFFNLVPHRFSPSFFLSSISAEASDASTLVPICCYVRLNLSIVSNVSSESSLT